jgi:hypothetical protein
MRIFGKMIMAIALALVLSGTAAAGQKTFEKTFTVQPGGALSLGTDVGSVAVRGTSSNEVSISVVIHGSDRDIAKFDVSASQSGNNVKVEGKMSGSGRWFWNSTDLDAEFTISVPHNYSVTLNTSGGNITVEKLNGTVKGETSGGSIHVAEIEGGINVETSGGDVSADICTGNVHLGTSGGSIKASGIKGDLDAGTSGGNVSVADINGKVHAETSGGNVSVKVSGSPKSVYAETSGGNIELVIPRSINATLDAETSGGSIQCDLPVTVSGRIDEGSLKGKINAGGELIHAHTSGGNVRIKAAE